MNLSELFPRKYACGEDLMGAPLTLTITRVSLETMSSGSFSSNEIKPVVYFSEIKKGVVLNKTLAFQIAEITGSKETETWAGKSITVFPEPITVAGRSRIAIRARRPDPQPAPSGLPSLSRGGVGGEVAPSNPGGEVTGIRFGSSQ